MPKSYLVLEFDDADDAQRLAEKLGDKKRVRAIGIYAIPIKFCECDPKQREFMVQGGLRIVHGQTYAWWVHDACRRPIRGRYMSPRNLLEGTTHDVKAPNFMFRT